MHELAAWNTYAKELFPLGHGHPLWYPAPCPDFGEVHIGDVGYLREGHFTFLFNAMRDADHPLNARGVPSGFKLFHLKDLIRTHLPDAITQTHLHSKSIRSVSISAAVSASEPGVAATAGLGLRYQCSEASGALLMLQQSAHKTYIDCRMHIQKYIITHISSWLDFANGLLGIGLEEKDIIFISGHTKTPMWAEAAFDQCSSGGELVITGGCAVPSVSGEFRVSMSHCQAAIVHAREGPADRVTAWKGGAGSADKYDQSIFINYYKVKRSRFRGVKVIRAAAGPHVLPDGDDDDNSENEQSDMAALSLSASDEDESDIVNKEYDPVDFLLDYILKHSDAQKACAADDDLIAIFQHQELIPEDLEGALEAMAPQVDVDDDGVGTVTRKSLANARFRNSSANVKSPSGISSSRPPGYPLLSRVHNACTPSSSNVTPLSEDIETRIRPRPSRDMDEMKDVASSFRFLMGPPEVHTDRQGLFVEAQTARPLSASAVDSEYLATDSNANSRFHDRSLPRPCGMEALLGSPQPSKHDAVAITSSGTTTLTGTISPRYYSTVTARTAVNQRSYRMCDQCSAVEQPGLAKYRLCGGCKTVQYCSTDCQKAHWPEHKVICQRFTAAQGSKSERSTMDEGLAKDLRKFVSAHASLLGWAGFQALQLKRVPSNIRHNALFVELSYRPSSPDSLRRFAIQSTRIVPRTYVTDNDQLISTDIHRREDRCRRSGGIGCAMIIIQCGGISQVMPVEVDSPSGISWDTREDWCDVLTHFVDSGRTDFKPISTTTRGIVYG